MRFFVLFCLLALAGVSSAQVSTCGPGKTCRSRAFVNDAQTILLGETTGPLGTTVPGFKYDPGSTSLGMCNANNASCVSLNIGSGVFTVPNLTTAGAVTAAYYSSSSYASAASLPSPASLRGWTAELATSRLWKSDTVRWTEIGSGTHPGLEKPTYFYVSDATAGANAPAWAVAPRAGGASVAFTSAGTLSNATTLSCSTAAGPCSSTAFTNYATTAVSGNQAHHSSAVWTGSAFRWSATVSVPTLTSGRFFAGMSNTLPLVAGSSTPTAHAAVFRYDSGIGANIFACTGAGAAVSCVNTGVAAVGGFDLAHRLAIDCREASVGTTTRCFFWVDGIVRNTVTTTLPAARLGSTISLETLTAASRSFSFSVVAVEPL